MQGISNQASSVAATMNASPVGGTQNKVQGMLLKKALEGQKSDVAQLLQMLEGKGKIVDIRA
jgi:hypothetical protein